MGLQIGFIFFDPMTSFDDMKLDADFLNELGELYVLFNFIQNMDVYPGTLYRRQLELRGLSTATHPYKGGFRQYRYADDRIAPLAVHLESLYTSSKELMAADQAIWRLKIFNLPKLRWLRGLGLMPSRIGRETEDIQEQTNELCDALNRLHYDFLGMAIDVAECGYNRDKVEVCARSLFRRRGKQIDRLHALGERSSAMEAAVRQRPAGPRIRS
jgi:hypothetical protein